jgi:phospholipid/cholesterol/gamma-HCH transport system permease protein
MIEKFFSFLGSPIVDAARSIEKFGAFLLFQFFLFPSYFSRPLRLQQTLRQILAVGYESLGVILLTAVFIGLVQAIQMYQGFHKFGAETMMGYTIFYAIGREIGPVFTALMIVSRAISAMAAELGTMRVTEQIDAIDTLGIDSQKFLVVPRIIATTLALPILILIFDVVANISSYAISVTALDLTTTAYTNTISQYLKVADYGIGMIKGVVFGLLIGMIGSYVGYHTHGGARGVGQSTTKAVVISSVTVLIADYFMGVIFLYLDI